MSRRPISVGAGGMLALMLLAACTPHSSTAPATAVTAADTDSPAPPLPAAADPREDDAGPPAAPAGVSITRAQLLGTFHADSNRNRTFQFTADGRYVLLGGAVWDRVESTWTLEDNGTRVRLHPDHRDREDVLFVVESPDLLLLINNDGTATSFRNTLLRVVP